MVALLLVLAVARADFSVRMETFKNVKVDDKSVSQTLPRGVICDGLPARLKGTGPD